MKACIRLLGVGITVPIAKSMRFRNRMSIMKGMHLAFPKNWRVSNDMLCVFDKKLFYVLTKTHLRIPKIHLNLGLTRYISPPSLELHNALESPHDRPQRHALLRRCLPARHSPTPLLPICRTTYKIRDTDLAPKHLPYHRLNLPRHHRRVMVP
jgi:hypothetical protein